LKEIEDWVGTCYPNGKAPSNRIVKIADKVCLYGLSYKQIQANERAADAMWEDFFKPMLAEYKEHADFNQETYDSAYKNILESIWAHGPAHSFRCEWIWMRTRVRYFEIVPTWELERIADDTQDEWDALVSFRNTLVNEHGIPAEGIYADDYMNKMEELKNRIIAFMNKYAKADGEIYDTNGELHRLKLKDTLFDRATDAREIYQWHYLMAKKQLKWKEGRPHDLVSANYLWADPTAKFVREHFMSYSREGFMMKIQRELEKLYFHTWRRI
jgi:hypothetical protein